MTEVKKKIHTILINDIPDADLTEKKAAFLKIVKENREAFLILPGKRNDSLTS